MLTRSCNFNLVIQVVIFLNLTIFTGKDSSIIFSFSLKSFKLLMFQHRFGKFCLVKFYFKFIMHM